MVFSNQLVERINLDYVECNEGANKGTYAPPIDNLLLRTHIVKCSQVNHISNSHHINKGVHKPAVALLSVKVQWLCLALFLCEWNHLYFLASLELLIQHQVLGIAHLTVCVQEIIEHIVIEAWPQFGYVVNLIFKYF